MTQGSRDALSNPEPDARGSLQFQDRDPEPVVLGAPQISDRERVWGKKFENPFGKNVFSVVE